MAKLTQNVIVVTADPNRIATIKELRVDMMANTSYEMASCPTGRKDMQGHTVTFKLLPSVHIDCDLIPGLYMYSICKLILNSNISSKGFSTISSLECMKGFQMGIHLFEF